MNDRTDAQENVKVAVNVLKGLAENESGQYKVEARETSIHNEYKFEVVVDIGHPEWMMQQYGVDNVITAMYGGGFTVAVQSKMRPVIREIRKELGIRVFTVDITSKGRTKTVNRISDEDTARIQDVLRKRFILDLEPKERNTKSHNEIKMDAIITFVGNSIAAGGMSEEGVREMLTASKYTDDAIQYIIDRAKAVVPTA